MTTRCIPLFVAILMLPIAVSAQPCSGETLPAAAAVPMPQRDASVGEGMSFTIVHCWGCGPSVAEVFVFGQVLGLFLLPPFVVWQRRDRLVLLRLSCPSR